MQYFSTNRRSARVSFREAVLGGQPDDGGLYFPEAIPRLSGDFRRGFRDLSNEDIAFQVIRPYVSGEIPDSEIERICAETVSFPFPLVPVTDTISTIELFHGPTLAFKDVGARFMSRCLRYFLKGSGQRTMVIVATSGDTGSAVAHGFHKIEGIDVVILYPKGRVSRVQKLQLTSLADNVITLEVRGSFDECQALAKSALRDTQLARLIHVTSANSINVARWLPQQFYYFYALKQWDRDPPVISVPSGNFGNMAAGLVAYLSGLTVAKFVAACNANDTVPRYLESGRFEPGGSVATLSNAMDVANPSNFPRILEMFGGDRERLTGILEAMSISDSETAATMRSIALSNGYVLDPHGAVGFAALEQYLSEHPEQRGIFLETAHPIKFESVKEIIGNYDVSPDVLKNLELSERHAVEIDADYEELKDILIRRI
jgi:threonine synthase